jgi:hypothetical protein
MKIIAIKDMSAGNESVGEMWQETKIFNDTDSLFEVMKWVGTHKKKVTLTIAHDDLGEFVEAI